MIRPRRQNNEEPNPIDPIGRLINGVGNPIDQNQVAEQRGS